MKLYTNNDDHHTLSADAELMSDRMYDCGDLGGQPDYCEQVRRAQLAVEHRRKLLCRPM